MADGGLSALQPPPVVPPAPSIHPPVPPIQLVVSPAQPLPTQPIQLPHMPQLNWSHFKPKCIGKPDEDVEAHLLRTNDWMDTQTFPEGVKVQHFCLPLAGQARI